MTVLLRPSGLLPVLATLHRCSICYATSWSIEESKPRYVDHQGYEWELNNRAVLERVKVVGFHLVGSISFIRPDHSLLTPFLNRWRGETNTFHMPVGEMTITQQDVEIITGLCVDGEPVIADCLGSCRAL